MAGCRGTSCTDEQRGDGGADYDKPLMHCFTPSV
jgi:hypothetical protein